jgi:hypothetical protein
VSRYAGVIKESRPGRKQSSVSDLNGKWNESNGRWLGKQLARDLMLTLAA